MGSYSYDVRNSRHSFSDLKEVMACASPHRSGDQLAGLAADGQERRIAARLVLADLPLSAFLDEQLIPYETDEVTRLIVDSHDTAAFGPVASLTVGGFREWLLAHETEASALQAVSPGLTPEMVAAVSKLMTNGDLISVAAKVEVVSRFRTTLGLPGRLSSRLQPNHPTDNPVGIMGSIIDGLMFGVGDAVIGINPATDNIDTCVRLLDMLEALRLRYEIPTQSCVLTHVTNMISTIARQAPVDLVFQSVAGSEAANKGFGVNLALLREAHDAVRGLGRAPEGANLMYFETGQGSALSSGNHAGVDQQTMEVRAYAVARAFSPFLVNTVVGFIGPEYLFDGKQIIRAGLEDNFCGKLLGLPMGVDVCYTNHAECDQDDMDTLATLLGVAGTGFLIAVPGADDVMLNYQSLSYHDIAGLRRNLGLRTAPEFEQWLQTMEMIDSRGHLLPPGKAGIPIRALMDAGR